MGNSCFVHHDKTHGQRTIVLGALLILLPLVMTEQLMDIVIRQCNLQAWYHLPHLLL